MAHKTSFTKFLRPSFFNYSFIEIVLSTFLSIFLIFFSFIKKEDNKQFRNYLLNFFTPISTVVSVPVVEVRKLFEAFNDFFALKKRNEELLSIIQENKKELSEMYHLKIENEKLKLLSNVKAPPASKAVIARIVFDPSNFASTNIFIDIGEEDGVKLNNPVFNENGIIGRVIKVQKNSSEVLLINDAKSFLPVVSSQSKINFFINGNNKKLVVLHLDNKDKLIDGELILSTSSSGYFKEGIRVGFVKKQGDETFIVPVAEKNDSVYVKVLIYEFEKIQPTF